MGRALAAAERVAARKGAASVAETHAPAPARDGAGAARRRPGGDPAGTRQDIIRDCYDDGRLDGNYTASQIRDARNNLPADVDQYSDCRDVLARALGGSGDKAVGGGSGGGGTAAAGARSAAAGWATAAAAEPLTASGPEEQQALDAAALSGGDKPIQVGDATIVPGRGRLRRRRRRATTFPRASSPP